MDAEAKVFFDDYVFFIYVIVSTPVAIMIKNFSPSASVIITWSGGFFYFAVSIRYYMLSKFTCGANSETKLIIL